ncbi:transcription termination factor NusA [Vallitaleaceae bacterium 9-2]|mgnify:FL=1
MNAEFIQALEQIEKEKNISKEVLLEAIENSLLTACKNHFGTSQNIQVTIDKEKGNVIVLAEKEVVENVEHKELQISLAEAREIDANLDVEDHVQIEVTPKDFGRIAAQKAKQVVVQKIREAERDLLLNSYQEKEKEVVTGIIQRSVKDSVIVNLGKIDAILADKEQVPGETYSINERIKVYVIEVKSGTKGPKIYVSRTHPDLVKRLFESEVPEVHDGTVEIKSISREAGSRTKIAVYSTKDEVDPVGSCVGHNGSRVSIIVDELNGEKIDIIPWNDNMAEFIAASLSPSKVVQVAVNKAEKSAKVIVPDYQLSLAIGKEGQNARLAAKLTGYRIDIKSETQAKEIGFITEEDLDNPEILFLSANSRQDVEVEINPFDESLFEE